jgi:MinD superfamily P-loop ATPase
MIRIAVVSGKGGTGKTILSASLVSPLHGEKVFIDADVDAANLALLLNPVDYSIIEFRGMEGAVIDPDKCCECGNCSAYCAYDAIRRKEDEYTVLPYRCEGCGVCLLVCPDDAIEMKPRVTGIIHKAKTEKGYLIYGSLSPGSGNSGLMVHRLRQEAEKDLPDGLLTIIDGPPGIGCPLISTITGVQVVIIVTEPGRSAIRDLMRLLPVCRKFKLGIFLVINRYDVCPEITEEIRLIADHEKIRILGEIPYDPLVVKAVRGGTSVTAMPGEASRAIHRIVKELNHELIVYDNNQR